ncbi:ABC transporter substrate-binding protein [Haloarcula pelagica]|nr:ABC transporter substrate-binding protein [Halomicroarcula sp. YJ-61-S]
MEREPDGSTTPTRREYVKYGGALIGGGLVAGCSSGSGSPDGSASTDDETAAATASAASTEQGYAVTMSPVGTVEFGSVPTDVAVYSLLYADAAVAYGHSGAVNSLGFDAETGGNTLDAYYERLDGVSFDSTELTQLNAGSGDVQVDKELLYELDSDLHLLDPALLDSFDGWDRSDIEDITDGVAPFFGNTFSRTHGAPPEGWRGSYEYYTLWEIVEKVAEVFRATDRYERLAAVREELVGEIQSSLPPESERPTVASGIFVEGSFYPSKLNSPGFGNAHTRPLGATDAFAGTDAGFGTTYDYETLLEVDPDVFLHQYGIAAYYDVADIRETVAADPVGGDLTAVTTDRFYPSGTPVQGPLMNLFQLEMTAKQLYPDRFGEWPGYTQGEPYPEIPEAERLFDRQRVADIVAGAF